jgi:LPXTG-motif cell wall-anchored protein
MIICSPLLLGAEKVEAAGAVTHYNVDFLQKPYTVGLSYNLVVAAADSTNATVAASRAVILTCSDPHAILPTTTTLPVNDGGYATCSMYFGTAGTQTVTVTDTADNTIVGSLTVSVAPIHLSVSVTPTTIIAGESVNVTVSALDASDNVLTTIGNSGYGNSLLFSSTDSQAVFPLHGSPSCLVNGVGVFNITLNTVGSQTVTVVNNAFPLVNVTTSAITVNANVTATPTPSPTPGSPTATPTSQPTDSPTATPTPTATATPATGDSQNNTILIIAVVVVVVVVVLLAVVFLRKKRGAGSDLPPPPPPPT